MNPHVRSEMRWRCVAPASSTGVCPARLTYDRTDPHTVTLTFTGQEHGDVLWSLSRELLTDGLDHPVGRGDVKVWPGALPNMVMVELASPTDPPHQFEVGRVRLTAFLRSTYLVVRLGQETAHLDIDSAVARILGGVS